MDWLKTIAESLATDLTHALELTGSRQGAIAHIKNKTVAGPAAWAAALHKLGW